MISQEVIDYVRKLELKWNKKLCCQDCLKISETCADGQIAVWNNTEGIWECGTVASGGVSSISEEGEAQLTGDVTLSEGDGITLTQVGNDIEISSTPVTLNPDTPTQDALNLSGQEIQINPATSTEYGVVRLSDVVPTVVANFAALPDPTTVSGKYYWAEASQGTKFIGALWGGTYYPAGLYYSNGTAFQYMDTPAQATQPQVDAGIVTNQWVAPSTLAASSQWATKNDAIQFQDEGVDLGSAGTVDTVDFTGSAVSTSRVGNVLTVAVSGSSPAVISPAQITADQNNYNPTGFSTATMVRLDFDTGGRAITGFAAGSDGQRITLSNISGNFGYYPGGHPDSSAGNRFLHGKDFTHYPYTNIDMIYDGTSGGWRVIGEENSDGKTGVFYKWSPGSIASGDHNELGTDINGGAISSVTATTSLPAGLAQGTSTSSTGQVGMYFAKTVNAFSAFESSHLFGEAVVSIPTLSTALESFTSTLQFTQNPINTDIDPINTIGIRHSDGINSGKWELFSQDNAGSESVADLGVTVQAGTLYTIRVEINKSKTEARAYVNGAYVGRVTGNMPNSTIVSCRMTTRKSAGTTARTLNVHSFSAGAIYQ